MSKFKKAMTGFSITAALVFLFALAPAGCGGSSSPNTVTMGNASFSPTTLTVTVGTQVTWNNTNSLTHTVTSDTGVFDSGYLEPGKTFTYTFNTAGTYPYHCILHNGMVGTIIVK